MASIDEVLYELEQELLETRIEGSLFASIWANTGVRTAASIVGKKRIELLVEGMLEDATEVSE